MDESVRIPFQYCIGQWCRQHSVSVSKGCLQLMLAVGRNLGQRTERHAAQDTSVLSCWNLATEKDVFNNIDLIQIFKNMVGRVVNNNQDAGK